MRRPNISEGRGQEFPEPIVLPELVASTFVASSEKFNELKSAAGYDDEAFMYSQWAFDGDFAEAFNDLEKTGVQIITQAILPRMSTENRVNFFISHDMFLGPLVAYCTNRKLTILRKHATVTEDCKDCRWIKYLEGIAIIVKADGDQVPRRYRDHRQGRRHAQIRPRLRQHDELGKPPVQPGIIDSNNRKPRPFRSGF